MQNLEKFSTIPMTFAFTGAHDATTIEIKKDFIVEGKEIPAGKYAFFTIPGKKSGQLLSIKTGNSIWQLNTMKKRMW